MVGSARDHLVSAQYETHPYPERNPADEKKRLVEGSPSGLAELSHYLFRGRTPNPFRALIAGGGTGDAAIMLAQHCADRPGLDAEITYLDMSEAARQVVEARAAARGLSNLRFVTGSLLDVADLAPGPYDYIDCCGVLHHLEVPGDGLAALVGVLKPSGGMGLMVYGEYGRRGVYETQDLLRLLAPPDQEPRQRLAQARRLLGALPRTNWLRRNPFVQDHAKAGDAGLYDLLLHARDRAFRVEELASLVRGADCEIQAFIEPASYDPSTYLSDRRLLAALAEASPLARAAAAEALAGNMRKHVIYVTPSAQALDRIAITSDHELVPTLARHTPDALAKALRNGGLKVDLDGFGAEFSAPNRAGAVVARMDGKRSIALIVNELMELDAKLTPARAQTIFDDAFGLLAKLNLAHLVSPL